MIERVLIHVKGELERAALHPTISEIMDSRFEPGYRQSAAAHAVWHLWYVLEGLANVSVAGAEFRASAGDMFLIPGGTIHALGIGDSGPCRIFDVKFELSAPAAEAGFLQRGRLHDHYGVRHLIERILVELARKAPAWETAVRGLFNEVLSETTRRLGGGGSSGPVRQPAQEAAAWRAVAFVEEHYARPIQLEDVAAHVALSPKYLAFIFRRVTGYTIKEFVTRIRMEEAKWFLAQTDMPVKEVAARVGYDNIHYFSKVFRAAVGIPPTVYRQHHDPGTPGKERPLQSLKRFEVSAP